MTKKNRLKPMLRQGRMALLFGITGTNGKLLREGGIKDSYSLLETLIFSKAATVSKETGTITFQFDKFSVPTTTFGEQPASLEEQDAEEAPVTSRRPGSRQPEAPSRKKAHRISNRLQWSEFYEQHKADVEALYETVTLRTMSGSELTAVLANDDIEDDDSDEGED